MYVHPDATRGNQHIPRTTVTFLFKCTKINELQNLQVQVILDFKEIIYTDSARATCVIVFRCNRTITDASQQK